MNDSPSPYRRTVVPLSEAGLPLPAWVLRLAVAATCGALAGVLLLDGAPPAFVFVLGLLAVATVLSPSSAAPAAVCGGAVLGLVIVSPDGSEPLRLAVLAVIVLVHLLHVLCGIAALVPLGARLHLPALRRPLLRLLSVQLGVFALAALTLAMPGGRNPVPLEIAAVLGVAAAAVFAVLLLRRR
jgi:hypothetical protein